MQYERTSRNIVLIVLAICLTGMTGLLAGYAILNGVRGPGVEPSALSSEERFNLGRNAFVTPAILPQSRPIKLDYGQSGAGRVLQPFEPARKRERAIMASYEADLYWSGYDSADPVDLRANDEAGPTYDETYDNRDHVTDFNVPDVKKEDRPKAATTTAKPAMQAASPSIAPVNVYRGKTVLAGQPLGKAVVIPVTVITIAAPTPDLAHSQPIGAKKRPQTSGNQPAGP